MRLPRAQILVEWGVLERRRFNPRWGLAALAPASGFAAPQPPDRVPKAPTRVPKPPKRKPKTPARVPKAAPEPTCMPPILRGEPSWRSSGRFRSKCTSSEKKKVREALDQAFSWVDRAQQFIALLSTLPAVQRERVWNWGYLAAGSKDATAAHRDREWKDFWSPASWFGPYSASKFSKVRERVYLIWDRMQHGTRRNRPMRFVCRSHRNCFGIAAAFHSPADVGRVTLCKDWFQDSSTNRAEKILHESMHYLVNDSIVKNRPRDVHNPACDGPLVRNICYGPDLSRRLLSRDQGKAVDNIENYVFWMKYFAKYTHCWPPRVVRHGEGRGIPGAWIPQPRP